MRKPVQVLLLIFVGLIFLSACSNNKSEKVSSSTTSVKESSAHSSAQPFEGILTMRTTIPDAGFTETKLFIAREGLRTESTAHIKNMPEGVQMVVVSPSEKPNLVYVVDTAKKSWMEVETGKTKKESTGAGSPDAFNDARIENLGKETMHGYNCTHVRITRGESVMELWVSKEILDYFTYARVQGTNDKTMSGLASRMKSEGLDGFPVKIWHKQSNIINELVKVEKHGLDASLFRVPAGYTKAEPPAMNGTTLPQQRKELEAMVKKMHEEMKKEKQ
ncbi:MAG: DUF4412 domain-containing protein [Chlorobium sp.]|nr:MAG: DUF4412 domain-containing protein [Chlorobium sp.]